MKNNFEAISMNIISIVGNAKSLAFEAIQNAKQGYFNSAQKNIKEAEQALNLANQEHFEIIDKETKGEKFDFSILFLHAEDQLMSSQMVIELSKEIIELYKKINGLL